MSKCCRVSAINIDMVTLLQKIIQIHVFILYNPEAQLSLYNDTWMFNHNILIYFFKTFILLLLLMIALQFEIEFLNCRLRI